MAAVRALLALLCSLTMMASSGAAPAAAVTYPSQVLDLANWKVTLPVDGSDDGITADEVTQPQLATYEHPDWFHANAEGNAVVLRAPANGATTPGTSYARSELREMPGGVDIGWPGLSGTHQMRLTQAITLTTPDTPNVVAGQVHELNGTQDVVQIRLEGARLFVESDGVDKGTLDSSYQPGEWFTVDIQTSPYGIRVTYNPGSQQVVRSFLPAGFETNWYFKAGLYLQSNEDSETDDAAEGEVVISQLSVTHSDQAPPPPPPSPSPPPPPPPAPVYCAGLVATQVGTDNGDVIYGTAGNDVIAAGGGNDTVYGLGGDDIVCGGLGSDTIKAGAGNRDQLYGEDGADKLVGGAGKRDVCVGGPARDRAKGCEVKRSI